MTNLFTPEALIRTAMLLLIFLAVVGGVYLVLVLVNQRRVAQARLPEARGAPSNLLGGEGSPGLRARDTRGAWVDLIQAVERSGIPLVDPKDPALRTRLVAAGYDSENAARTYSVVRLGMVMGLPLLLFALMWLLGMRPSVFRLYLVGAGAALLGLYLPSIFIRRRTAARQQEILNGFPDALDLLLVCVEAGLGLESAFSRVGEEMTESHPLLAQQFGAAVLELRAGRSHEDALRRMAERSGSEDIRGFATLLVQSTKLGSSIAQTLRIYSSEMRERRRLRAEEKAHRLPVLLSVPLVCFMLPSMIGVLMLPAALRVIRTLLPALQGNVH